MAARTCQIKTSLSDKIDILDKDVVGGCHTNQVFRTVSAILALVKVRSWSTHGLWILLMPNKDKMTRDKDSVRLSEYCFSVCETLKNAIQGRDVGDLSESEKVGM